MRIINPRPEIPETDHRPQLPSCCLTLVLLVLLLAVSGLVFHQAQAPLWAIAAWYAALLFISFAVWALDDGETLS